MLCQVVTLLKCKNKVSFQIRLISHIYLNILITEVYFLVFQFENGLRVSSNVILACSRWKCDSK